MSRLANYPDKPEIARSYFQKLFPDVNIDVSNFNIRHRWLPNYIMCYIAKVFNDNVFKLFNYKDIFEYETFIIEYPYDSSSTIYTLSEEEMRNPRPEKYYPETEERIEAVYDQLKNYIFDYINKHENDIKKNAVPEKINAEIVMISFSKDKLFNYFKTALDKGCPYENKVRDDGFYREMLSYIGIQTFHNCMKLDGKKFDADYVIGYPICIYASQLLAAISEKLYYYILSEIKRIVYDNNDGIVEPDVQPDIPSIEPALMESYNALDAYNKAVVSLFIQNMTKHSVLQ